MDIDSEVLEFLGILSLDVQNFSLEDLVYQYNTLLVGILDEKDIDVSRLSNLVFLLTKTLMQLFSMKPIPYPMVQKYILDQYCSLKSSPSQDKQFNEVEKLYMFSTVIVGRLREQNLDEVCGEVIASMYENACFIHSLWNGYDFENCSFELTLEAVEQLMKKIKG